MNWIPTHYKLLLQSEHIVDQNNSGKRLCGEKSRSQRANRQLHGENSVFAKAAHVLLYLVLSTHAYAIPIAFKFDPGAASLTGSFKYDFETELYSDINITGVAATYHWGPTDEGYSPAYRHTLWPISEGEDWSGRTMQISWLGVSALTVDGGAYSGYEPLGCSGGVCSGRIWEGTVSPVLTAAVPVASPFTLVLGGLTLLALHRRKIFRA